MSLLKQHCQRADFPLLGVQRAEYCGLDKFLVDDYLIFTGIEVIRIRPDTDPPNGGQAWM